MKILNLGCGTKTSAAPEVVNIDWSVKLLIKSNAVLRMLSPLLVRGVRASGFAALPDNILVHDLRKGIPFPENSADAVYHSHTFEHIDRQDVPAFLAEVRRVLKPDGVHRIVVPDLHQLCREYLEDFQACEAGKQPVEAHDARVAAFIEQCVRKESYWTSKQAPLRRMLENRLLGDARKRGETHQWMWDRFNLQQVLEEAGYRSVTECAHDQSRIPGWNAYGLDLENGHEYKPGSLYMEAMK